MKYYLKVGENTRVLYPGEFFVGSDGLNHNYTEIIGMTIIDRVAAGVYELSEDHADYENLYSPSGLQIRRIEENYIMRMLEGFYFRRDQYSCGVRDITLMNLLLSMAKDRSVNDIADTGNLNWLNADVPFYIHTNTGQLRNFDIPTLKLLVESMTYYIMACKIAAELLKFNATLGDIDPSDASNWPNTLNTTAKNCYEDFNQRYIEAKFGNTDGVYIDPDPPIDTILDM
jgi:hypothetical protein